MLTACHIKACTGSHLLEDHGKQAAESDSALGPLSLQHVCEQYLSRVPTAELSPCQPSSQTALATVGPLLAADRKAEARAEASTGHLFEYARTSRLVQPNRELQGLRVTLEIGQSVRQASTLGLPQLLAGVHAVGSTAVFAAVARGGAEVANGGLGQRVADLPGLGAIA